uniref:Uncharacterized protein n=1 Tax=Meloidogyne incognita TaxID=6306 RepID=A0A914LIS4_MELIC
MVDVRLLDQQPWYMQPILKLHMLSSLHFGSLDLLVQGHHNQQKLFPYCNTSCAVLVATARAFLLSSSWKESSSSVLS